MKQVFVQKGSATLKDVSLPLYGEYDVVVAVHYSFISTGTEGATLAASGESLVKRFIGKFSENTAKVMSAIKEDGISGTISLIKSKATQIMPIGYTCSGQVVKIGDKVEKFQVGDFVACAGAGLANHSEVVAVPVNLVVKLESDKYLKQTSLAAIGGIAMQGLRRANLSFGEKVCVVGLGLIGQLTVQLAKYSGLEVIGIDISDDRLELAKKLGCDSVLNPLKDDIKKVVDFKSDHYGVDATIITAAAKTGDIIQQAMEVTRRKGKVVLVGDVKIDFDRSPFYAKEIDFLISCSYGPGRYDRYYEQDGVDYPYAYVRWTENRNMQLFVDLIAQGKLLIDPIISKEFNIEDAEAAYNALMDNKSLGLVLAYNQKQNFSDASFGFAATREKSFDIEDIKPYVVPTGKVNVAAVGVGGFAKVKLLPILSHDKNVEIQAVVDASSAEGINVAGLYGAKKSTNNLDEVLVDLSINMVVLATPHKLHCEQTIKSLAAGKAVFVEKPAAVTWDGYKQLEDVLRRSDKSLYCVDFNRSFAPFNLAIKKEVAKRSTPLVINYRMNAGYIPKDHWVQSRENGGRIIGEACHIFELFCSLTESTPVSISLEGLNTKKDNLFAQDNFSATVRFDDGSVCNLIYTAIGSKQQSKERMELFFDGKSIEMNDYKELVGYGLPSSFNQKTNVADKGHETLLKSFIGAIRGKSQLPISFDRILMATKISLIVDDMARSVGTCEDDRVIKVKKFDNLFK